MEPLIIRDYPNENDYLFKERKMTNETVNTVANVVNEIAPESVAAQTITAVATTIIDPSPVNIVSDLALAVELVNEFKSKISGLHPSIGNIIKALF
jgi:hypothetical protein